MTPTPSTQFKVGGRIRYDDGHEHRDGCATIMDVGAAGMLVWFDDRADTTYIRFDDAAWMNFISLC